MNQTIETSIPVLRHRYAILLFVWLGAGCGPHSKTLAAGSSVDTKPTGISHASQSPAKLHPLGVGELVPGAPIPESVYSGEGSSFDALWTQPIQDLSQMEEFVQGFRDQAGYPLVRLSKMDVVARLTHDLTVLGIWVGEAVRTKQGTGLGSTLSELQAAHGPLSQHNIPEPYHCAVKTSALKHVSFLFKNPCSKLQPDTPCAAVYVGGYEDPAMD